MTPPAITQARGTDEARPEEAYRFDEEPSPNPVILVLVLLALLLAVWGLIWGPIAAL